METSVKKLRVDRSLDVRGETAPANYLKAKEALGGLIEDQVLELYLDEGEPLRRIPFGLRAEGHEILVSEPAKNGVRLLVRKRPPLS